jgi:CysZ protein
MRILSEITRALSAYGQALTLIRQRGLARKVMLSALLYLVLVGMCSVLLWKGTGQLSTYILEWPLLDRLRGITDAAWVQTLMRWAIFLSSFFLFVSVYKYLFLALASPLFAWLSESAAEALQGRTYPFSLGQFLHDAGRGILISLRNFLAQLSLTILLFILSLIPAVGWIFSLCILLLDCYYYGFSMMDYNCERHRMSMRTARGYIRKHAGLAIGNGLVMYFSLAIPFLGAAIIAPLSAVAAAITFYRYTPHHEQPLPS